MIEKIEKSVTVPLTRDAAFTLFTRQISRWWPVARHSFAPANHEHAPGDTAQITVEPHKGGRIFEVLADGHQAAWATITDWTPGHRVSFDWYAGRDPAQATTVAVTFTQTDTGATHIRLVHDGFDALAATPFAQDETVLALAA